jgi:hypothetical protein
MCNAIEAGGNRFRRDKPDGSAGGPREARFAAMARNLLPKIVRKSGGGLFDNEK